LYNKGLCGKYKNRRELVFVIIKKAKQKGGKNV